MVNLSDQVLFEVLSPDGMESIWQEGFMTKSNFFRTLSEADKNAARELAEGETKRLGKKVTMLEICDGVMTDAERVAPEVQVLAAA